MNVVMIMAGGVGNRFGSNIPKQYIRLNGKPIIDYVIENVKKSKSTDKILIVIDILIFFQIIHLILLKTVVKDMNLLKMDLIILRHIIIAIKFLLPMLLHLLYILN